MESPAQFSPWRLWPSEAFGRVYVARDRYVEGKPLPEHLVIVGDGPLWMPHREGGEVDSLSIFALVNYLMKPEAFQ
jgi:hypothetical protein